MRVAILADIHEMLRQLSREISKCAAIIALRRVSAAEMVRVRWVRVKRALRALRRSH